MELITERINNIVIDYDELWQTNVRDKFCRKQEDIKRTENRFFSQYWQGFAWAAIIGFIKNRSLELDPSTKASSFRFQVISNQSPRIAKALILLAISKSDNGLEILREPDKIAKIISEHAKGGADYIKELRETPGYENYFDSEDDYLNELIERK